MNNYYKKEYQRLRKALAERKRYYTNQGYVTYDLPETPYSKYGKNIEDEESAYQNALDELEFFEYEFEQDIKEQVSTVKTKSKELNITQDFIKETLKEERRRIFVEHSKLVVDTYLDNLNKFDYLPGTRLIKDKIDSLLKTGSDDNINRIANALQVADTNGVKLSFEMMYKEELAQNYLDELSLEFMEEGLLSEDEFLELSDEVNI